MIDTDRKNQIRQLFWTVFICASVLSASVQAVTIITGVPTDTTVIPAGITWQRTIAIEKQGFDWPFSWSVSSVGQAPIGKFDIKNDFQGVFRFTPSWGDTGKSFRFELKIIDEGRDSIMDEFTLFVRDLIPPVITVHTNHSYLQAGNERVPVLKSGGELKAASMKLSIAFGEGAIFFDSISISESAINSGWRFYSYTRRRINYGELGLSASVIDVYGTNAARNPVQLPDGKLFDLCFTTSGDDEFDGRFDRISFVWTDCQCNTFRNFDFDTTYLAREVEYFDQWGGRKTSLAGARVDCQSPTVLSALGPCALCLADTSGNRHVSQIIFRSGGIARVCCVNPPRTFGDINHNDIPYEVADFALLSKMIVDFDTESAIPDEQGDANQDGTIASVADMVFLARVIIGDALPFPKLMPYQKSALIERRNDTLFVESSDSIAGVLMLFKAGEEVGFENLTGIEMMVGRRGSLTSVLFKPALANLQGHIPPGRSPLLRVKGKCELQDVGVSDYNGCCMNVRK